MERDFSNGSVTLFYDGWHAVLAALDGDISQRDEAFDALHKWAPRPWLEALEQREGAGHELHGYGAP